MSKKAIEEISSELELFRNKLSTLQTTVNYLQNAKEIAGGAIKAIEKTDQNFNIRIAELKHAYHKVVEFEKNITELVEKIGNVNFPERLDKIETSLNKALGDLGDTKDVFVDELLKVTTEIHAVVSKIDEFIINYQGILDEQIRGLKNEIESLRKYLQELDFKGIVTSAQEELSREIKLNTNKIDENSKAVTSTKTELIDTFNAKTETLLEKLGGLGVAVKSVAEQTEATHKLCSKEFPALSEKIGQEAAKVNTNVQAVQANTQTIINTIDQIDFPTQFRVIHSANTETKENLLFVKNELSIVRQQMSSVAEDLRAVKVGQLANRNILDAMNQRLLSVETHQNDVVAKLSESQKAQRLQFIIVLAVVVVFGIVLLLK